MGPIDYSQRGASPNDGNTIKRRRISFQGVRWIRVNDSAISNISYVGIDDIRAKKLPVTVPKIPSGPSRIPDDTNPPAQLPPTEPKKPAKPPILADKGKVSIDAAGATVKSGG